MKKTFSYDLHVHSCLSPCADDDMTPGNIAGMAAVQGLDVVALTDHNSAKNCPAFFAHAEKFGIIPVAGMELTTAEDIHMLCLFPTLEAAMRFDAVVEESLIKVKNKPRIFGNQYIMNGDDEVAGEVEHLLINATSIDVASAWRMCLDLGGACYPAHIDRDSNGMLAVLGDFPEDVPFAAFELNDKQSYHRLAERLPHLKEKRYVVSSDAHNLWSVSEAENTVVLEGDDKALSLIKYLRGEG